ncbi:hypothetical protein E1B28_012424 [Marasmius oreades]|uniref:Complex 1 LYR protein domain-containing protein n=1 Tax=Marasmius oreades TaxID=181124 RepID=A0A9P7RSH3_9AGAR|nr:uncharacterized protein E1B28_012424 [Marasmius oreades]KAG7088431.1 hypothetical protein E1B28_012424 [Marasmius oreades]
MSLRKSGLQKEVLSLYRRALRMVRSKSSAGRPKFSLFIRYTFRTNATSISPRNVSAIEHLLRKGRRQLDLYESPSVKDCWVSEEMKTWDRTQRLPEKQSATLDIYALRYPTFTRGKRKRASFEIPVCAVRSEYLSKYGPGCGMSSSSVFLLMSSVSLWLQADQRSVRGK